MSTFLSDVRFALRTLARRPAFTAAAVSTIALGIGANTAVFTVVNGFLLEPLPYEEPERLVSLVDVNPELGRPASSVSPANAWDWRSRSRTLEDLALFYEDGFNLTGDGLPELVPAVRVTPNILRVLGRTPALGRDFSSDEVGEGRHQVAILTDGFWARRFGRDPSVVGATLDLDGYAYTVVGIMPPDFRFLDEMPDVLVPQDVHPDGAERAGRYAEALGRLAPGATLDGAREELRGLARALEAEHPDANRGWTVEVVPLRDQLLGRMARQASHMLMAAVGLVLLMACVNVANLLLARAGSRGRELAVRAALGAGRGRVVRQLLTESLVLGVLGGGLGLVLGVVGSRGIVRALPSTLPPVFRFEVDGTVLAFVGLVTVGSVLVFGIVPALGSARSVAEALPGGGRATPDRRAGRLGASLVVLQISLAVVLLVGAGLLMKSIAGMRSRDVGFDPGNVLAVRLAPPSSAYPGTDELRTFWSEVEERVAALPGVVAVGQTQSHPLMGENWGHTVRIAGGEETDLPVRTTWASPGLFEALRLRVVRGRAIETSDRADAPPVAVVNETFVARYVDAASDPLAEQLVLEPGVVIPIVGVVEDVVERAVDAPPEPAWYVPASHAGARTRSLVLRTSGPPEEALPEVRAAIWSVDPDLPVQDVETMEGLIRRRLRSYDVIAELMATFALLSLALGVVGIYGVTAQGTERRRREIGLRVAVGAGKGEVVRMVLLDGARRAALGMALGLVAATGFSRLLDSMLVGVSPDDPAVFASVAGLLAAASLAGVYLPARRAARVDPVQALAGE